MRTYAPNQEGDIVLACGCVVWAWGQIHDLGSNKWYQDCKTHPGGSGKWGMQRVLREATLSESIQFRDGGIPAPKRRSKNASRWLSDMPGKSATQTRSQRGGKQERLF